MIPQLLSLERPYAFVFGAWLHLPLPDGSSFKYLNEPGTHSVVSR